MKRLHGSKSPLKVQFDYFVVYPLCGSICQNNIACETYLATEIRKYSEHLITSGTALLSRNYNALMSRNCKGTLDALWMMLRAMVASTKIKLHIKIIEKR